METEKLVIEIQAIADGVEGTIDSVRQELDALTQQMDTYNGQLGKIAGAQAGAKDTADTLKDAIKGITDAAEGAGKLSEAFEKIAGTSDKTESAGKTFGSIASTIGTVASSLGTIGSIISGVMEVYGAYQKFREEQEKERAQLQTELDGLVALKNEYETLTQKTTLSVDESKRLSEVINTLSGKYGIARESLAELNGTYDTGNRLLDIQIQKLIEAEAALSGYKDKADEATVENGLEAKRTLELYEGVAKLYESLSQKTAWGEADIETLRTLIDLASELNIQAKDNVKRMFYDGNWLIGWYEPKVGDTIDQADLTDRVQGHEKVESDELKSAVDKAVQTVENELKGALLLTGASPELAQAAAQMYGAILGGAELDKETLDSITDETFLNQFAEALMKGDISGGYEKMKALQQSILSEIALEDSDKDAIIADYTAFRDEIFKVLGEQGITVPEGMSGLVMEALLPDMGARMENNPESFFNSYDPYFAANADKAASGAPNMKREYEETLNAAADLLEIEEALNTLQSADATENEKKLAAIKLVAEGYGYCLDNAEQQALAQEAISKSIALANDQIDTQKQKMQSMRDVLQEAVNDGVGTPAIEAAIAMLNVALSETIHSVSQMREMSQSGMNDYAYAFQGNTKMGEAGQNALGRMYEAILSTGVGEGQENTLAQQIAEAFSTDEVAAAYQTLERMREDILNREIFTRDDLSEMQSQFGVFLAALSNGMGEQISEFSIEHYALIMDALWPSAGKLFRDSEGYFQALQEQADYSRPKQALEEANTGTDMANASLEQAKAELDAFNLLQDAEQQGAEERAQALQTLIEYRNMDKTALGELLQMQYDSALAEAEMQEAAQEAALAQAEAALQAFEAQHQGMTLTAEEIALQKELELAVANARVKMGKGANTDTFAAEMDAAADSAGKLETETDDLATNLSEMQKKASSLQKNLELKRTLRDNTKAQLEMVQAINKSEKSQEKFGKSFESLAQIMGTTDPVELEEKLQAMFDTASEEADVAESGLYEFYNELIQTKQQIEEGAYGVVDIETQSALDGLIAVIAKLLQIDNLSVENGLKDERESGGGGGKSRKQREEEEAKRAAEEARRAQEEAYREALGRIDHLKKMDRLSGEQEIEMLLEVQRVHAQTAEQRLDMEERIYAARKELAEKQYNDALAEIDHLMALDQISAEEELKRLEQVQSEYVTTDEQRREMAEKVYASRKALQQKAYDDALEDIDRKMRMDEIGAEEEVALLEEVARVHAQTGEQRLDIEERLYAARKALAEQQYSDALSEIEHMLRMDEIGAEEELTMLEDVEAQYAKTAEQKREMEERIYAARKQLQEDAFNDELGRIDRLKSRNEISTQEQIEQLERVAQTHAQTAEQREKIEDKLYQAQQALRKEEEASINRLNSGLLTALRGRYEEQRDAEVERLNESKQAWKDWSDVSCEAIQAQIDALDEQAEAEDREKTDAENMRAIDKAQQALVYETDEYNRKQLEKQIAELEEKRAEQLKKWEVSDRKEALREEMENAKERAKAEQEAIQSEIDRVKELYAERLEAASLQAEAEQLLMKGNQEEILKLIESYAPDYEATGKTLGERLFEGIRNGMGGDITEWMQDTNAIAEQMRKRFIEQMQSLANGFNIGNVANEVEQPERKNINITQNINISNREDSPYEISRQVNRMGQKLADML